MQAVGKKLAVVEVCVQRPFVQKKIRLKLKFKKKLVQAVGKKLAVVEVCVGKGVARVRAGRRAGVNQVNKQIRKKQTNKQIKERKTHVIHVLGVLFPDFFGDP